MPRSRLILASSCLLRCFRSPGVPHLVRVAAGWAVRLLRRAVRTAAVVPPRLAERAAVRPRRAARRVRAVSRRRARAARNGRHDRDGRCLLHGWHDWYRWYLILGRFHRDGRHDRDRRLAGNGRDHRRSGRRRPCDGQLGLLTGDPPTGPTAPAQPYYFNLGDMRLINNRWGSDALGCSSTVESVCIYTDGSFGWTFNRATCGGKRGDPDFPEVEFGVAPFGNQSSNLTSPPYSSTTLLPIQLSALNSATLNMSNYNTTGAAASEKARTRNAAYRMFELLQRNLRAEGDRVEGLSDLRVAQNSVSEAGRDRTDAADVRVLQLKRELERRGIPVDRTR